MQIALILVLAGIMIICIWGIVEKIRNQKAVDNGIFKGVFLQKTGRARVLMCKLGRNTPEIPETYVGVAVGWQEVIVQIPGKDEEQCPRYFTNKYATFTDRWPGGKGIWSKITSVDMPMTTWHMGNPIPAVTKQPAEQAKESQTIVAEIVGYLRDEKASEIAMQAASRNFKLEEAIKKQINPNYILLGFAAILVTCILAVYFTLQLQSDINQMDNDINSSLDSLRTLLGGSVK